MIRTEFRREPVEINKRTGRLTIKALISYPGAFNVYHTPSGTYLGVFWAEADFAPVEKISETRVVPKDVLRRLFPD